MPIRTFADQTTADVAVARNTKHSRRIAQHAIKAARRKLDMLHAATSIADLAALPGNRLEDLRHTKPGFHSIRVNDQYRVFFRFENGDAYDVEIEGYDHSGRR